MGFGSAPVAFGMLVEAMERDPSLRASLLQEPAHMGYGGATLSNDVYERHAGAGDRRDRLAHPAHHHVRRDRDPGHHRRPLETERVGLIGLPLPGITLKLVPNGSKLEVRVKGPTVTTGYHNDPEKTAAAFDEEGFYKLGDAVPVPRSRTSRSRGWCSTAG